ncbi:hypothetical protein ONE63_011595 [Megalurothrips usitatus]|uniref:Uncharacterized protein n=1 Tax=Megalurothrips usitatus TaxID=439358 RepID=A0AAV7X2Z6_9NEOP|nr:hypothetical protein ONE63_011595 [Megalurothrips usitatus]
MVQGASGGDNPTNNPKNPSHIYNNFKEALIYSRLEDTKNMTLALELVVRKRHPRGKTIRYRTLEAVTTIHLAAQGIPTDPEELEQKIRGAYARRGLTLDLDQPQDHNVGWALNIAARLGKYPDEVAFELQDRIAALVRREGPRLLQRFRNGEEPFAEPAARAPQPEDDDEEAVDDPV